MAAFQIDRVQIMGHIPPREMFDRAMTILHGRATEGTIRVGDLVTLPDGREMVLHGIEVFAGLQEATAPAEAALMFRGHVEGISAPSEVQINPRRIPVEVQTKINPRRIPVEVQTKLRKRNFSGFLAWVFSVVSVVSGGRCR